MFPPTLISSFAFLLPVSTGPNAMAFARSGMTTMQMVRVGAVLNVITLGVVMAMSSTYAGLIFDFSTFPEWAEAGGGGDSGAVNVCAA